MPAQSDHHLHEDRRGPRARHLLPPADRAGLHEARGHQRRDARHLPRRPHPGNFCGQAAGEPAHGRRPGRTRRPHAQARGQHHQAAEYFRLPAAAAGSHRRAAGPRLRGAELSGSRPDRRREGRQGPLRQGEGLRREPGPARGQLRPPGPEGREGLRPGASALDGRLVDHVQDQRRHHGPP